MADETPRSYSFMQTPQQDTMKTENYSPLEIFSHDHRAQPNNDCASEMDLPEDKEDNSLSDSFIQLKGEQDRVQETCSDDQGCEMSTDVIKNYDCVSEIAIDLSTRKKEVQDESSANDQGCQNSIIKASTKNGVVSELNMDTSIQIKEENYWVQETTSGAKEAMASIDERMYNESDLIDDQHHSVFHGTMPIQYQDLIKKKNHHDWSKETCLVNHIAQQSMENPGPNSEMEFTDSTQHSHLSGGIPMKVGDVMNKDRHEHEGTYSEEAGAGSQKSYILPRISEYSIDEVFREHKTPGEWSNRSTNSHELQGSENSSSTPQSSVIGMKPPTMDSGTLSQEVPLFCAICDISFPTYQSFSEHNRIHSVETPTVCNICGKVFTNRYTLTVHSRIHSGEKPFACEICDKRFSRKDVLIKHSKIHSGEKPFACEICGKAFVCKGALTQHTRTHSTEKPFVCVICNKAFTQEANLMVHTRLHTGEKPFECDVCGKAFTRKDLLIRHSKIHSGDKPFVCKICDKAFTQEADFVAHKEIHSGDNPFVCEECGKSFSHKHTLLRHIRIHLGEKPYVCEICDKAFGQEANLIVHKRIHTGEKPFECEECGKAFTRKDLLIKHCKIHSGEKPFVCEICDKAFAQKTNLTGHYRTHSGDKPYECEDCGKSFAKKSHLIRHTKTHL